MDSKNVDSEQSLQIYSLFETSIHVPYFFAYKTVFFSFQNNPKNLDPSYKTDLDLWDCLGRVKPV